MKTLTEKQQHWSLIIEDWSHSGLSQAEYCRRYNLNPDHFYGWKHTLAKIHRHKTDDGEFLPLAVIENNAADSIVLCVAGVEVRYQYDTDPELLKQLVHTLRAAS